ncbi:hypothetical protein [Pedobacter xixiisoli]|nr:hypothetical protein [Pedobacter xixiisoli]
MKKKKRADIEFPETLLKSWELSDGVNFAIALSRITGWLLHVDWWCISENDPIEQMKSLRVYVGVDNDTVYDFRGKKRAQAFAHYVITPIAQKRVTGKGIVLTRFYSEETLMTLPLRVKPSETEIAKAKEAIINNRNFLNKLPIRLNPEIPAHIAAQFNFGWCAVYAEAKREISNLPVFGIIAKKYIDAYSNSSLGFCHSVVIHPDGDAEDSWGKQPLSNIIANFGIQEYELDEEVQKEVNSNLKRNSPEKYKEAYEMAMAYIKV